MAITVTSSAGDNRVIGQREFVTLMAAIMSLNALAIDSMLPALDDIAASLNVLDQNQRQFVIGSYMISSGLGCLIPGLLADRFGRRPILVLTFAIYALASLLCAWATSFEMLIAFRMAQGFGTAGLAVLPAAIIRDRFEGDAMARLMSLIFIVFMVVPVLAPGVGQAVMLFASWRWIFVVMAILASLVCAWTWVRLPETLAPQDRQPIDVRTIARNLPLTLRTRVAIGYVLGSAITFGALFGYINSAQQLIGEHFGAERYFALIFGVTASTLAISSFANSRIVERFGARRVSHTALVTFIAVSAVQVYAAIDHPDSLAWFIPLMSANLCLLGFIGSNFGSIAMQPFYDTAGAASSVQAFIRMGTGAGLGILIGQAYNGSALPLALALLICSLLGLLLVLYSERGVLFRRPRDARKYLAMHEVL
ncbi:multidrug effflux MFS transporter [Altererythrobacter sp.]|uniref:multidrug effflux MFS transporter n=1 Tax=Altererythrobacter sp. TaxID=1872480 RepID=UPI003D04578D